jgi:hypothetical protein
VRGPTLRSSQGGRTPAGRSSRPTLSTADLSVDEQSDRAGAATAIGVKRQCPPRTMRPLSTRRVRAAPAQALPMQIDRCGRRCASPAYGATGPQLRLPGAVSDGIYGRRRRACTSPARRVQRRRRQLGTTSSRRRLAHRRQPRSCSSGSTHADRSPTRGFIKTSCGAQRPSTRSPATGFPTRAEARSAATSTVTGPSHYDLHVEIVETAFGVGARFEDHAAVTELLLCASVSSPPVDLTTSPCAKAFLARTVDQVRPEVIVGVGAAVDEYFRSRATSRGDLVFRAVMGGHHAWLVPVPHPNARGLSSHTRRLAARTTGRWIREILDNGAPSERPPFCGSVAGGWMALSGQAPVARAPARQPSSTTKLDTTTAQWMRWTAVRSRSAGARS